MSDNIDQETREALLQALEELHEYKEKEERRRQKQLWREFIVPSSLVDMLARLTKK